MPNIKSYNASPVSLQPSERGAQAYDTAGRRIGPLYNAAGSDIREQGRLEAAGIKSRLWPLDIARLNNLGAEGSAAKASSLKVVGGVNSGYGGPTEGGAGWAGHGQISRGAAALGNLLSDGGYAAGSTRGGRLLDAPVEEAATSASPRSSLKHYPDDTASPVTKAAGAAAAPIESYWDAPDVSSATPAAAPASQGFMSSVWSGLTGLADWIDSGATPAVTDIPGSEF